MVKRNELLEMDIKNRIEEMRYEKPQSEKNRQSVFYLSIIILVTISILFSLLRSIV